MTRYHAKQLGFSAGQDAREQLEKAPIYDEAQELATARLESLALPTRPERVGYRNGFVAGVLGASTF